MRSSYHWSFYQKKKVENRYACMREGKREIISMDGKEIKISRTKLVFRRHIYTLKLEKPIEISTSTPIETYLLRIREPFV
jgi:hypothetical protein